MGRRQRKFQPRPQSRAPQLCVRRHGYRPDRSRKTNRHAAGVGQCVGFNREVPFQAGQGMWLPDTLTIRHGSLAYIEIAQEVPSAPRFNHRFSNVDEAYVAFAVANLRYLGASVWRSGGQHLSVTLYCNRRADVACPFKAVLGPDETESYAVVLPESTLRHNHGPRSQLVDDPSWRPPIRCPLVLAALGGSAPSPVQVRTPSWRFRFLPADFERSVQPSMKRQLSPSHDSQPFKRSRVDAPPQPADKTHGPIASTARTPYPTPPLSVQTPSSIHIPLYGLTSDSAAGVPLEDRVSLVQAFLFGIEPAIAPLAPCLVAAGIDSLEALVSLAALSPAIRKVLLEDVDREVAADGQNGLPSAICLVPSFPS